MQTFDFNYYLDQSKEIGTVQHVIGALVLAIGLPSVKFGEVVVFETNQIGYVWGFSNEYVEILNLSNVAIKLGTKITRTGKLLKINCGEFLLGRTVNAVGEIFGEVEAKGHEEGTERELFGNSPPLLDRDMVDRPFVSGVSLVDLMVPLGKGQRQLIIGDRKTGKTDFLAQLVKMQKKDNVICVYAAIGKRLRDISEMRAFFLKESLTQHTLIVSASASESPALIFLTPFTAVAIAEYFKDLGRDVLLILDDMTSHAVSYRELSLAAKRFPGRDSYPGDIFYIHSQIMERAGNFDKGSITCLPVAEMVMGDFSGFIQTNLMSMTDGHVFFDADFRSQGREPAINHFLSVTRVGLQAQLPLIKEIASFTSRLLTRHKELSDFAHFGAESTPEVRKIVSQGDKIYALLGQDSLVVRNQKLSAFVFCCIVSGRWDEKSSAQIAGFTEELNTQYETNVRFRNLVNQTVEASSSIEMATAVIQNGTFNEYIV